MTNNSKLLAFSALAILLTAGFPAMAEDDSPKDDSHQRRGNEMFLKADTDKDGFLSKEEMLKAHEARLNEMFAKADTNHDGKLSKEELRKGHEAMRKKMQERMKDMKEKRGEWRDRKGDDRGQDNRDPEARGPEDRGPEDRGPDHGPDDVGSDN